MYAKEKNKEKIQGNNSLKQKEKAPADTHNTIHKRRICKSGMVSSFLSQIG